MVRTAIQLFTLKDLEDPLPDVVSRVGETAFDGVEFYDAHFDAFEDDAVLDRTADALEAADLGVAGAHVGVDRLESSMEAVADACTALGCTTLVVPSYDGEAFTTADGTAAAADHVAGLADDLADHDLSLLYHNHTFEFGDVDGGVAFERFVASANGRFGFEPDVGLATHAGYDALELLDLVGDRAPVVHLTDSIPDDPDAVHADPGTGVLDLEACADAAAANGAEWFVCENGLTADPIESLETGSAVFADLRERVESR